MKDVLMTILIVRVAKFYTIQILYFPTEFRIEIKSIRN